MKLILVDMDGVIADFERGFLNNWIKQNPDKPYIPLEKRTTFYVRKQYIYEFKDRIDNVCDCVETIYLSSGFYRFLPPIPGSLKALSEMKDMGYEVFICTSPKSGNEHCIKEKYEWIEQHLDKDWLRRVVVTKDKTIIKADCLIDDKPGIKGVIKNPSWEHIIYDQPYNREITSTRRLTWRTWESVLGL